MKLMFVPLEVLAASVALGLSLLAVPTLSSDGATQSSGSSQSSSPADEPSYINQLPQVSYLDFPSPGPGVTILNNTADVRKVLLDGLQVKQSPEAKIYLDKDKQHPEGGVDVLIDTAGLCHFAVGKINFLSDGAFTLQRVNGTNDEACPVTQKHLTATAAVPELLWTATPVKIARISHGDGAADTFIVGRGHHALEFEKFSGSHRITWEHPRKPLNP